MPMEEGRLVCINHPDKQLAQKLKLTRFPECEKKGLEVIEYEESGILAKVFACPKCGYIELYYAK